MTEEILKEKFKEIKDIENNIEQKEYKIRVIDSLITSCGLSCKITGTPRGKFRTLPQYHFSNKEEIIKILKLDKEKLMDELIELKRIFSVKLS